MRPPGHALITGASSGIGGALARELARCGWRVSLVARRRGALEALQRDIEARGGRATCEAANVGAREELLAAVGRLEGELGPVDLLVANAGVACGTDPLRPDGRHFAREVQTNLLGAWHAIEAVLPGMVARGRGHVAVVSSLAGWRGVPGSPGYGATKAGLSQLLASFRIDWLRAGITTTTVHPGFVATEMTADHAHPMPFLMSAERAARIIARAIHRGRKRCDFPRRMVWFVRLSRLLPDAWVARLAR